MKLHTLIAASLVLVAPQVFAQAKSFEGFSLGANVEFTQTKTDVATLGDSGNSTGLGLQAQYSFALAPQFVMGVGATLGTGNRKTADVAGPLGFEGYTKNNASFDLIPGYAVSDTLLVFGKVSALNAKLEDAAGTTSLSLSGVGYGIGVRSMFNKNVFFQAGYDSNKFNDVTSGANTFSTKSTVFSLGGGYKF